MARVGRPPSCECGDCPKCRARVRARERYQALSPEERRAFVARRDPELVRANDRRRYRRDKLKRRQAMDEYARQNRETVNAAKVRYIERNPEKRAAHQAVSNAIRDGRLKRQPCEICGTTKNVHGHHFDYDRPLDVKWLCSRCHTGEHIILRDLEEAA